ncbi:unnamed protein product [Rotaria sordida]|uniref:Uncharacterized protein n=1 Tax=Rotaria sordida TaxID=392033 RepID=A0A818M3U9_9BILA|nr:unnamed protein product [Rotaria sordida]CAF0910866.1 unnamed protein product [Rotaria sordida]CAF1056101.1 unnamed protein product [Rotaria sordida]CAF3584538.1 unnamed protein product [Rotaria sordida]
MTYTWKIPSFSDESFSSPYVNDHFDNNLSSSSIYDGFNKMMATVRQHFQQMSALSLSLAKGYTADLMEVKKKLDTVVPACTTTTTNLLPTRSIKNNRRKSLRTTQTTTCVKKLIIDGEKYIYKEITVTNDKGKVISQINKYESISINTINDTTPSNVNE